MNKKISALGIFFMFLLICLIAPSALGIDTRVGGYSKKILGSTSTTVNRNTLYVGGNGQNNYSSIQAAINDAEGGDTIFVYDDSSPYYENVMINKTLTLIGEDMYTTIIDANGAGDVVVINSQGVEIAGFTMRNSGAWTPGKPGPAGIFVNNSDNNDIHGNILSDNECGMWVIGSTNNIIHNCKMINNADRGINLHSSYNTIFDNIVSENEFGMWLAGTNNFVHDCEVINNNNIGVCLDWSSYNNISRNNIVSNGRGMDLYYSSHNEIFENFIDGNSWGLGLYWGSSSVSSSYNIVKKNIVSNNMGGIELWGKTNGDVSYNVVSGNNVTNNEGGILVRPYTSNNEIYHNNLVDNINPLTDEPNNACDYGENFWDNGETGNYWSDYQEKYPNAQPRLLKPWIWNTPYKLDPDEYNKDRYPLVEKYNGSISSQQSQDASISLSSQQSNDQSISCQSSNQLLLKMMQRLLLNIR